MNVLEELRELRQLADDVDPDCMSARTAYETFGLKAFTAIRLIVDRLDEIENRVTNALGSVRSEYKNADTEGREEDARYWKRGVEYFEWFQRLLRGEE
jgi:hypothetical protein